MRWLLISILVLSGCTTAPVSLKHQTTGDVAQCGPYLITASQDTAWREHQCIQDFQRQGYARSVE